MSAAVLHAAVAPIDPTSPLQEGKYVDGLVTVARLRGPRRDIDPGTIRTRHFDLRRQGERIEIAHVIAPQLVDDHLTSVLCRELFEPGWVAGLDIFERIFTGIVRTLAADPVTAWAMFYCNSLRRTARPSKPGALSVNDEDLALVRGHLSAVLRPGSLLDMGSCFGFLALELARSGRSVTASDTSRGTMEVLAAVAERLRIPVTTVVGDAAHLSVPDGSFDNVTALHLLEHVDAEHGRRIVTEAIRIARRRVTIAVPLEEEPNEAFGHVRIIGLADLAAIGAESGRPYDVYEHHGGWLIIDTDR